MSVTNNVLKFVSRRGATSNLTNPQAWFLNMFGGWGTASGKSITPDGAKNVSAFYACVAILAETIGWLPLIVYRSKKDKGKDRAKDLDVYRILHDEPNPEQTPFEFKEMMVGHLALRGNFYARKEIDNSGTLRALWPLHPDRVRPYRTERGIVYELTPGSGPAPKFTRDQIFHVRLSASDGLSGDGIVKFMMESLGLAMAAEEFGARFFSNDATPSGVLYSDKKFSDPAYARLKADLDSRAGSQQSHRHMILEEGLKWQAIGITARDAQLLELRRFTVSDIARYFRIPPFMVGETDKVSSWGSGIESLGIGFVQYTLMPWLSRIEQASDRDLLTPTERKRHYSKFLVNALFRGDAAARSAFYTQMFMIGAFSQNDIRELEDQNPIDDGDKYFVPLNMREHDQPVPSATPAPDNPAPDMQPSE